MNIRWKFQKKPFDEYYKIKIEQAKKYIKQYNLVKIYN